MPCSSCPSDPPARAPSARWHIISKGMGFPPRRSAWCGNIRRRLPPPRALWVPFEWGRPLGVSGNANFQTRVLRAALQLLEAPSGPVVVDFPEDAPPVADDATPLACPISFAPLPEDLWATRHHLSVYSCIATTSRFLSSRREPLGS
jgi:hypothetical protein